MSSNERQYGEGVGGDRGVKEPRHSTYSYRLQTSRNHGCHFLHGCVAKSSLLPRVVTSSCIIKVQTINDLDAVVNR